MIGRHDSRRLSMQRHKLRRRTIGGPSVLAAEQLEARQLLSVSGSWNSNLSKLTVVGTTAGDEIFVRARSGYVSVENEAGSNVHWDGSVAGVTPAMVQFIDLAGTSSLPGADGADKLHLGAVSSSSGFTGIVGVTINGGHGNDTITGSAFADLILGHKGADLICAGAGDDTVTFTGGVDGDGGEGNDTIYGEAGDDSINGGSGNDQIDGGDGNDWIHGGDGGEGDSLSGGAGNDTIYGGDGAEGDTISGDAGNDALYGGTGSDFYLFSGSSLGENLIFESASLDQDIIDFTGFTSPVTVNLGITTQQEVGGSTKLTLSDAQGVENVRGTSGADYILGNARNNILIGGAGNDTLIGEDGHDLLLGGGGSDALQGGAGRDVLIGGDAADTLDAGADDDLLWGGNVSFLEAEETAWPKVLAEWMSGASYNVRVGRLSGDAGGTNAGAYLDSAALLDDSAVDSLTGSEGSDWLLSDHVLDSLTDLATGELTSPNTSPTTAGISSIVANEDAAPVLIDLTAAFSDGQQASSTLTYSIVSNSNPGLISASINPTTGVLTVAFAANGSGAGSLTVSATDASGFTTSTNLDVDVAPVNDAPLIVVDPEDTARFDWSVGFGNEYTFTGKVIDESPGGLTIVFGGILEGHSTTTAANGTFVYVVVLPEEPEGDVTAVTVDAGGLESNMASCEITFA